MRLLQEKQPGLQNSQSLSLIPWVLQTLSDRDDVLPLLLPSFMIKFGIMVETLFSACSLCCVMYTLPSRGEKQRTAYGKSEDVRFPMQAGQIHLLLSTLAERGAEVGVCWLLRTLWLSLPQYDLDLERGKLFLDRNTTDWNKSILSPDFYEEVQGFFWNGFQPTSVYILTENHAVGSL